MKNVISKAIPTALTVVINIVIIAIICYNMKISVEEYSSLCVILTAFTGLWLLSNLCKPLDIFKIKNNQIENNYVSQGIKTALFICMIVLFTFGITVLKNWFSITISLKSLKILAIMVCISSICFWG